MASKKIKLNIRTDDAGKKYLYFPFMSVSDIHLGTKQSRAKRVSSMLEHTLVDHLQLAGDVIDGEYLTKKSTWKFGPAHRQVIGHFFRKAGSGTTVVMNDGNHEESPVYQGVRERLRGMDVYGVKIEETTVYDTPKSQQKVFISHGDVHDQNLFKKPGTQKGWYRFGDRSLEALYNIDSVLRYLGSDFSVAASGKKMVKGIIKKKLGVDRFINSMLDKSPYDTYIYGHTHMAGFERTPKGKLIINDGCCTEHAQCLVHDDEDNWAILEWHKDKLSILEEEQDWIHIAWSDIGLSHFSKDPIEYNDKYIEYTDKVLKLVAQTWPAKDRQKALKKLFDLSATLENDPSNKKILFKLEKARQDPALRF